MNNARVVFALSFGTALAVACGGSSTNGPDGGGDGSSSGSSGGSSSGSGSGGSSGSSSGAADAGREGGGMMPACMIGGCPTGQVCCQMGCQPQAMCGMGGNRQLCTTNTECPTAFPSCRAAGGGGTMTCRTCAATTDCPTGESCCVSTGGGGMGGAPNTCAATCPTGSNPACNVPADCTGGLVCCQMGPSCQAQTACGMAGNRQICATDAQCPAAFPVCRMAAGGGMGTCRVPAAMDGGTDGAPGDGGPADTGPADTAPADAPTSG
jgi:hypothetical protein